MNPISVKGSIQKLVKTLRVSILSLRLSLEILLRAMKNFKRLSMPFTSNVFPRIVILVLLKSRMSNKRNSIGEEGNMSGGHRKTNHGNYQIKHRLSITVILIWTICQGLS